MKDRYILLKNATFIDENGAIHKNMNLQILNGIITYVGNEYRDSDDIVDCSNYTITPGFVNLHTHSPMNILKGIAEDVEIEEWFNEEIWPYESKFEAEDVYIGARLAAYEMIDNGVTAYADHYFNADKICEAALETGIRLDIAPTIFADLDNFEQQLAEAKEIINKYNGEQGRISVRLGPHAPYTCSEERLKIIVNEAKKLNVGLHIHASETSTQVVTSMETLNKTPIQVLNDSGCLDVPIIIAHALYLVKQDPTYINDNVTIALCPKTYLKLAMGEGTVWDRYKELPLAIGTDGAASSNSLNPLEQARLLGLLGKNFLHSAKEFTLIDIWKILMKGHTALNFNSGKIEVGKAADLIFWDLNQINTMPINNILAAILYSADRGNIHHVMIQGKFVKKDGIVSIPEGFSEKVNSRVQSLLARGKGKAKLNL